MKNYPNLKINFSSCEAEPIQHIGRIQAHGYLVALQPEDFQILQCSTNLSSLFGRPLSEILGESFLNFIDASQRGLFSSWLSKSFGYWINPFTVLFDSKQAANPQRFNVIAHDTNGSIILEIEPVSALDFSLQSYYQHQVNQAVHRFQQSNKLTKNAQIAAEVIANITEYDHVMIFQYDESHNGKVIAESRKDEAVNSFLEHRFPPSDIPEQARDMLKQKRTRQISNVHKEGVPIHPYINPQTGKPSNLLMAELRNPSEIHLEYLKNMGVKATFTVAIVVQDKLWGLVCGQHRSPRFLSFDLRQFCETIVSLMANRIEQITELEQTQQLREYLEISNLINQQLYQALDLPKGLCSGEHTILDLNKATGVVLVYQNEQYHIGQTPSQGEILKLIDWLEGSQSDKIFATRNLGKLFPSNANYESISSGLLALEIARSTKDYILWFKPEIQQIEKWGGNPHKSYEENILSPRKTFESWIEKSRGFSESWEYAEIEAAKQLRINLLEIIQVKNYELKRINEELREALIREQELNQELTSTEEELRQTYESLNMMVKQLSQSESQLKAIYESTTDSNFLLGPNHEVLAYNRVGAESIKRIFNKQVRIGDDMKIYSGQDSIEDFRLHFDLAMRGQIIQVERRIEHEAGQAFWFKVSYYPVYNREGVIWAVSFNSTDITRERQAQEEAYRLSLVARYTDNAVIITDVAGNTQWVNEGFTRITGYTLAEIKGKPPGDVLQGPETDPLTIRQIGEALRRKESITVEILNYNKAGEKYWLEMNIQPLFNQQRQITGFMAVETDITERKQTQEELVKRERRLNSLIHSQSNFLIRINHKGLYTFANDAFREVISLRNGIEQQSFLELLIPQERQEMERIIRRCEQKTDKLSKLLLRHKGRLVEWEFVGVHNIKGALVEIQGVGNDITEQHENQQRLAESESKYRLLADNAQDLVCLHRPNMELLYLSPSLQNILGYQESDLLYKKPWRLIHPEDLQGIHSLLKQSQRKNSIPRQYWRYEYRLQRKDRKYIWVETFLRLIRDDKQEVINLQSTSRDVTERRTVLEKLKDREHFIRQVASTTPSIIYVIDLSQQRLAYINRTIHKVLGYTRHQMIRMKDQTLQNLLHPEDFEIFYQHYETLLSLEVGDIEECSYRLKHREGEWRWILSRDTVFVKNEQGVAHQILGTAVDITESRRAQDRLRQSEARMKNVFDSTDMGIFSLNRDFQVITQNQMFAQSFKAYFGETINVNDALIDKLPEHLRQTVKNTLQTTLDNGVQQTIIDQLTLPYKPNTSKYFEFTISPTKVNQEVRGVVVVAKDITDKQETQRNLLLAKERAEEMSRLKTNFLANMSHEIRTPINGILGIAQIIEQEEDIEEIKQYVKLQQQSGKRLLDTITGILNLSRLEAEQEKINFELVEVNNIIQEVSLTLKVLAEQKNIAFKTHLYPEALYCLGDETMLYQILNNIIGNAIKFTPKGEVLVSTQKQSEKLIISVKDTGIGIEQTFISKIFESFTQESSGLNRKYEGSGLGLSIAQKYIALLGGKITVNSQKEAGSEFKITLPLAPLPNDF